MSNQYLEIMERLQSGATVSKSDWDYDHVMMNTRRLVKKYGLEWEREQVIPTDFSIADRVFQAGMELIETAGVYYQTNAKVLRFERGELREGLRTAPIRLEMGTGKDARTLHARRILDNRPPLVWGGNPGAPTPEEIFLPMVLSWMQEPIIDLATCGSLTHVDGHEVRTGEPTEILATRKELRLLRQALAQVGRPGMGLLAAQSSVSELGDLAVSHPEYLRPTDAHLVVMLNELIFDQKNLARVVNSLDYGMRNASLATVMVGGLGGDAPGAAVLQTASLITANLICQADYHLLHPIHIRHVATSTRAVMWVQAVVLQAFARNAPAIIVTDIYPKSGAGTRELFYEVAANSIVAATCGGHLEGVGSADGALPNCSGLECRWMGEVGHAVTVSIPDLESANEFLNQLLLKYEKIFDRSLENRGLPFDQVYNLERLTPLPAWQKLYDEVKSELERTGLSFNS